MSKQIAALPAVNKCASPFPNSNGPFFRAILLIGLQNRQVGRHIYSLQSTQDSQHLFTRGLLIFHRLTTPARVGWGAFCLQGGFPFQVMRRQAQSHGGLARDALVSPVGKIRAPFLLLVKLKFKGIP